MTRRRGLRFAEKVARLTALAGVALAPALVACSYDTGTGPLAIGPDTYTMSKRYAPVGASADAAETETVPTPTNIVRNRGDSSYNWARTRRPAPAILRAPPISR